MSFVFKHLCKYYIVLDIHKGVMTTNDVREECLECHMTSNDIKGECYITMMTVRCVNKPDQTEPVGCYENSFIPKFAQLCYIKLLFDIFYVCFATRKEKNKLNSSSSFS